MTKQILAYGAILALIILLIKIMDMRIMQQDLSIETYAGIIAILFTIIGIWVGFSSKKPKEIIVTETILASDYSEELAIQNAERFELSLRELEVLQMMANGLSNQEMADAMFISLNTVKTHCSNVYRKLDVKRRTQAVALAKELGIVKG